MSENGFSWDMGIATLSTYDADGFLGVSVGRYGAEKQGVAPIEVHHPFGFVSRPLDPDVDGTGQPLNGCAVLYATEGDKLHAWLASDPRATAKLPQAKPGESFMYGSAGQFIRCHADGAISLFTTDDATPNGRSIYFRISPDKGFEFVCPWARLTLGPMGFHVLHTSGARIDLGSIGGLPAPLDALASYVKLQAATASILASAVSHGTDGGAANAAAVLALQTFATAIVTALATATPASGLSGASAALAAPLAAFMLAAPSIGKVA